MSKAREEMKRAYRTTWNGITSIVAAESRSQAQSRTMLSAANAGYHPYWNDIRIARAPEYDAWAAVDETMCCWDENNLPKSSVMT